jgi:hypothetical protein
MQKNCSTPDLAKLLLLFVVLLFAREGQSQKVQPQKTPVTPEAAPPLPGLVITLEKQAIREEEQVPVHLVLFNSSDEPLSDVTLSWNLPSALLTLYPQPCSTAPHGIQPPSGNASAQKFVWGAIPANKEAGSVQTRDFCLVSSSMAGEDTYTLSFLLQYAWLQNGAVTRGALVQEKPIKSAFLGSDTFAGVPLGLASLVVAGLLFWLTLDAFQTPWRVQGGVLGDKLIYSVLVSLALMIVLGHFDPLKSFFDIASGVSMEKVGMLAAVGAAFGLITGGTDHALRQRNARQSLHADDPDLVLFAKLLELNKGKKTPSTVLRCKDGTLYRGSVGARNGTGSFLMGWYQIEGVDPTQPIRGTIDGLLKKGDYVTALKVALKDKSGVTVTSNDYIYRQLPGKPEDQTEHLMRVVKSTDEAPGPLDTTDTAAYAPLILK